MLKTKNIMLNNRIETHVLEVVSNFSRKRNWRYGLRQKYLYRILQGLGYSYESISDALQRMELARLVYKIHRYEHIYWFVSKGYRS